MAPVDNSFNLTASSLDAMQRGYERAKVLDNNVPWRAHFYESSRRIAWYCHDALPETDHWYERLRTAKERVARLSVGIAGPFDVIKDETVLLKADALDANVMSFDINPRTKHIRPAITTYSTVADFIYERNLKLSTDTSAAILDRLLSRCTTEKHNQKKGVLLEVLTAVLLSQVDGFEVTARGISNRTQQIDVTVHNRNTSGVLRRGEMVLAEAKNWATSPGVSQYNAFYSKLATKRGRVELGFFVTTDRFPKTVALEDLRNSRDSIVVVTLDRTSLPATWRDGEKNITEMVERAVIHATLR